MKPLKIEETNSNKFQSINQALNLLNRAAVDSAQDIQYMIDKDYKGLKQVLSRPKEGNLKEPEARQALKELQQNATVRLHQARDQMLDTAKQTLHSVDSTAHKSPWIFIGVATAAASILGIVIGRKLKH